MGRCGWENYFTKRAEGNLDIFQFLYFEFVCLLPPIPNQETFFHHRKIKI